MFVFLSSIKSIAMRCFRIILRWRFVPSEGSWSNHGESEREALDTPSSEIDEENREKMQQVQSFQAVAFANPPPAPLPIERTEGNTPFNVIGVDFARPVKYRDKRKVEKKAYVVLYS